MGTTPGGRVVVRHAGDQPMRALQLRGAGDADDSGPSQADRTRGGVGVVSGVGKPLGSRVSTNDLPSMSSG